MRNQFGLSQCYSHAYIKKKEDLGGGINEDAPVGAWSLRLGKEGTMKISCVGRCRIEEFLANLKCPNCFSVKVKDREGGVGNAQSQGCQCQVEMRREEMLYPRWE